MSSAFPVSRSEAIAIENLFWQVVASELAEHDLRVDIIHLAAMLGTKAGTPPAPTPGSGARKNLEYYEAILRFIEERGSANINQAPFNSEEQLLLTDFECEDLVSSLWQVATLSDKFSAESFYWATVLDYRANPSKERMQDLSEIYAKVSEFLYAKIVSLDTKGTD